MNKEFKVLLVEDEESIIDLIVKRLTNICDNIDIKIVKNKKEAIDVLEDNAYFFDLISLDLQIPIDNEKLEKSSSNGLSVLSVCQTNAKGTPIIILTGTSTVDMIGDFLSISTNLPIWFDDNIYSTISHFPKRKLDEYIFKVESIYKSVISLFDIELEIEDTTKLSIEHDRLIRMFIKSTSGVRAKVSKIGGGLSDSSVYSLFIFNESGSLTHQTIAKCGPNNEILLDAANYDNYISRLNPSSTPRKLRYIEYGAKAQAGVFYGLASDYNMSFFKSSKNNQNTKEIRNYLKKMTVEWQQAKSHTRISIQEIRRNLVSDKNASVVFSEFKLDWAESFEAMEIQINSSFYHGDLHGENVLVDTEKGLTTLIDYGDINQGPITIDPITLECSFLFHPNGIIDSEWPKIENLENWEDIEKYSDGCPVADEIHFCREWANEVKGSNRELAASLYSYALRQLKYGDTDKEIALSLLSASRRIIANS